MIEKATPVVYQAMILIFRSYVSPAVTQIVYRRRLDVLFGWRRTKNRFERQSSGAGFTTPSDWRAKKTTNDQT
jgi:hypothetical protein